MRPEFIFAVTSLFLRNVHVKLCFNTQILMMKNEQEQEYTTHNQCPPPASRFLDLPSPLWRKACWHKITPSSLSRISICMYVQTVHRLFLTKYVIHDIIICRIYLQTNIQIPSGLGSYTARILHTLRNNRHKNKICPASIFKNRII